MESPPDARYERLRDVILARVAELENDAEDADVAAASYRGHDIEAEVDLRRAANRTRARARELRQLLEAAG